MDRERQAFLNAIHAEPQNYLHRYVFADWLDEHGEHDEATRQRAFEQADRWLRQFAVEANLSYEKVIKAGHTFVTTGAPFVQYRDLSASNAICDDETCAAYWANWEVVTGVPVPANKRTDDVFICDCSSAGDWEE